MDDQTLESLLVENLSKFQNADEKNKDNVELIQKTLKLWNQKKGEYNGSLLEWWKDRGLDAVIALNTYLFFLWTKENKIDGEFFSKAYEILDPIISSQSNIRIVVTTGSDEPNINAGFLKQDNNFSFLDYDFSRSARDMQATHRDNKSSHPYTLDFILDFLSFLVNKHGEGFLGFRQIPSSKQTSSERATIHVGFGYEEKIQFVDYDFPHIEEGIKRTKVEQDTLLVRLLHVRHRALLESHLESRLIVLWAFLETLWEEEKTEDDKLLTGEEIDQVQKLLETASIDPKKLEEVIKVIPNLKKEFKTDIAKLTSHIQELECGKNWDKDKTRKIRNMRGKFAHGTSMREEEKAIVHTYVSSIIEILNELITKQFLRRHGIGFGK